MTEKFTTIIVPVDRDLEEIVPSYLENRRKDVVLLKEFLEQGDFHALHTLGHRMKGSGTGYGFNAISEIGRSIEKSAKESCSDSLKSSIFRLESFLNQVEVVYK